MSECTDNTKPLSGRSAPVTIEAASAKTLAGLGYTIDPLAKEIVISADLELDKSNDIIAKFSRDPAFTPTASTGNPMLRADVITLTKEQFGAKFIATQGDIVVFVESFEFEAPV